MEDIDQELMRLTMSMARVSKAYLAACDKLAARFGLTQAVAWPAVMIGRLGDGVRPGAVAEALGVEPSTVVRLIDQLIGSGLVERHEDASDRRAKKLSLTKEGRERVGQIESALIPFRRELFKDVGIDDIAACTRLFGSLARSIAEYDETRSGGKES